MQLSDRERRLIYALRKCRFARFAGTVENGCLMTVKIEQHLRLDKNEEVVDFSAQKCYTDPITE